MRKKYRCGARVPLHKIKIIIYLQPIVNTIIIMSDNIQVQMTEQIYNKRVRCEYTTEKQIGMNIAKIGILLVMRRLARKGIIKMRYYNKLLHMLLQ
jgi:hypothetical protein